jgi:hypothetical protein
MIKESSFSLLINSLLPLSIKNFLCNIQAYLNNFKYLAYYKIIITNITRYLDLLFDFLLGIHKILNLSVLVLEKCSLTVRLYKENWMYTMEIAGFENIFLKIIEISGT